MAIKRINRLTDLLAQCLAGFLISIAGILIMDGLFALIGIGKFGDLNGWLALIFPIMVFVGQFQAAKGERGRIIIAALGAVVGLGLGSTAAGAFAHLPAIGSGAVGALLATLVYAAIWHIGLAIAAKAA